jgi:nucleoside-diphosphate-sugar epimerase
MKIVLTGANGYIGSRLCNLAAAQEIAIIALSRNMPLLPVSQWLAFDLTDTSPIQLPMGTLAVIHLAANTSSSPDLSPEQEITAAGALLSAAKTISAKFIFISSQAARRDAPTDYGRIKWLIEQNVLAAGGWVVRPGQVYGGKRKGLFATLQNFVEKMPLLPTLWPAPLVQPIHVDDLCIALLKLVTNDFISPGIHCWGAIHPISFNVFLRSIAKYRLRKFKLFIFFPATLIKILEGIVPSRSFKDTLNRLLSLIELQVMPTKVDLEKVGMILRPLSSGMHPSGDDRRRLLLLEARAFFSYVLSKNADLGLLRRYVHVIERLRNGEALTLPSLFTKYPFCLALLEHCVQKKFSQKPEFLWRLNTATVLAEATPMGALQFLGVEKSSGALKSIWQIIQALVREIIWRLFSLLSKPFISINAKSVGSE